MYIGIIVYLRDEARVRKSGRGVLEPGGQAQHRTPNPCLVPCNIQAKHVLVSVVLQCEGVGDACWRTSAPNEKAHRHVDADIRKLQPGGAQAEAADLKLWRRHDADGEQRAPALHRNRRGGRAAADDAYLEIRRLGVLVFLFYFNAKMPCGFADNQATTEPLLIAVSALSALSAGATRLARLGRAVHSRSCVIMSPMGADARVLAIQAQCLADDIEVTPEMAGWSDTELVAFFESGGRPAPACVSSGATMRVLCLHGGGANRQVMEFQTALLRSTLGPGANFDYLEGDRPWKDADVEPGLRRMFGDGPYFGWYGVEHDGPTSDAGGLAGLAAYMKVLEDVDNVTFTYSGVELAVAKLEAHIAQNGAVVSRSAAPQPLSFCQHRRLSAAFDLLYLMPGPVDAIVGFSQGAIVATLATALSLERQSRGDG